MAVAQDLPISSLELYDRLKRRGVLVVSGHFLSRVTEPWEHTRQCLRITIRGTKLIGLKKGFACWPRSACGVRRAPVVMTS